MNLNRILEMKKSPVNESGQYVLYWMQNAQRYHDNHALNHAVEKANELNVPLVVLFVVMPDFPSANRRHFNFMFQGLKETFRACEKAGAEVVIRWGDVESNVTGIAQGSKFTVFDISPMPHMFNMRRKIASALDIPCAYVDTDSIVPFIKVTNKEEYAAYTIRRKIMKDLHEYLDLPENVPVISNKKSVGLEKLTFKEALERLKEYHFPVEVPDARGWTGGFSQGMKRFEDFLESGGLKRYHYEGGDPVLDASSKISPYLHFGQISVVRICMKALCKTGGKGCQEFIEQLAVRMGLARNFVFFNDNYNNIKSLPDWANTTLKEHSQDKREYTYELEEFEEAKTHDPYWNAAQNEMRITGYMHGYMRMYWGKKVIEWSRTPKEAYDILIYLNDKYQLDGRDPNGYAGIAWCFGKHDRAWAERAVFGKIRYMNAKGLERKFIIDDYVKRIAALQE